MSFERNKLIGWSAAFGALWIWSCWLVVSRFGVEQTLTIYDMVFLRFFVASVVVAPLAFKFWPRQLKLWQILVLSAGPGTPYVLLAFSGMQFAPASHAGVLMNGTIPIFSMLLAWIWMRQRSDRWAVAGVVIILLGCFCIGWQSGDGGSHDKIWIGHLLFVSTSIIISVYSIATKVWSITPLQAMVSIPLVNIVFYGPIYLLGLPKNIGQAPINEILLQGLYQGIGPSVLGVLFFTTAVRHIGPTATAAGLAGVPALASLLAIPILDEWPTAMVWIGLFLATTGIAVAAGWRPAKAATN